MPSKPSHIIPWLLSIGLVLSSQACSLGQRGPRETPATPLGTQTFPIEAPAIQSTPTAGRAESTATPASLPAGGESATPIPANVTITAIKGNLFIRRGPDVAFNPVGVLVDGQSAPGLGRDVLSEWVQIPLPGSPDKTGWVSTLTKYSLVSGNVKDLPEIEQTDWPTLASVENCTYHLMEIRPGEIPLWPITDFPDNSVRLIPGTYTIHDMEVAGSPEVMTVEVQEGSEIQVREDGTGERRKCPAY